MTVEKAIMIANRLRPRNDFALEDKYRWLAEADALIRSQVIRKSLTGSYENVGADLAGDEMDETTELLVPPPYDGLYPHYLAGQMDSALGEMDRAANELGQYNTLLSSFAVWMRQNYPPAGRRQIRY